MSREDDLRSQPLPVGPRFPLLERFTAGVLIVVLAALGWVLLAASQPAESAWAATEMQVVLLLGLLLAALILVSVVALLHTRS
jgi:hypothetical protein